MKYATRLNRRTAAALWLFVLPISVLFAKKPPPNSNEHWVTTWATAQSLGPVPEIGGRAGSRRGGSRQNRAPSPIGNIPETFKDQTVRMIVRTSIGGSRVRAQLSNALGNRPLLVGAAHIGIRQEGAAIVPASDRVLKFGGRTSFTIPPGALVVSDPVDLELPKLAYLAVSVYLPDDTGSPTVHALGLHTTYITDGDATGSAKWTPSSTATAYFWLSSVDVLAPSDAAVIAAFGDSITDGFATTVDKDHAWPALLAPRLASNKSTAKVGVVNLGISGNRVLRDVADTSALARFDRDVLSRSSVRWMTLLEGINDITFSAIPGLSGEAVTAEDLIWGYRQIIERAHLHGIKVAGATIMPVEGVPTYTEKGEEVRQAVNQWIRTGGAFDAVIDFDALVRDPTNPKRLRAEFDSGDHVHPNDRGNEAMADAIEISNFVH
jgi:lysophospholipase L1-like esterase